MCAVTNETQWIDTLVLPHFELLATHHSDCTLAAWCSFYRGNYRQCVERLQYNELEHPEAVRASFSPYV